MQLYNQKEYEPGNIWITRKDLEAISESRKFKIIKAKESVLLLDYVYERRFFKEYVKVLYDNQIFYLANVDVAHCFITNPNET